MRYLLITLCALQGCLIHKLDASNLPGPDQGDKLYLFLHLPIRQLPDGQPLLQVSTAKI